jgi:hypothetical protein
MAIATKRRRPFTFRGRRFVWDANDEWTLRIASIDKQFSISLPVVFPPFEPWSAWPKNSIPVYVAGPEFPGLNGRKDVWLRCRTIGTEELRASPGCVARVLEWSFDSSKDIEILPVS